MGIDSSNFLNITKRISEIKSKEISLFETNRNVDITEENNKLVFKTQQADTATLNGKTISLFSDISDEKLQSIMTSGRHTIVSSDNADNETNIKDESEVSANSNKSGFSDESEDNLTPAQQLNIGFSLKTEDVKNQIYSFFHPSISLSGEYSFKNVDELFSYINNQFPYVTVDKTTGIKKEYLVKLSQIDSKEDSSGDFFGCLNRAFSEKNYNEYISYDEIKALLIKSAGKDSSVSATEFQKKAEQYSQKIQIQFASLKTNEAKMEFILEKTEQYLQAAGLEMQLAAMQALIEAEKDNLNPNKNQICNKGQIAFAKLDDGNLGGYSYLIDFNRFKDDNSTEYYYDYNGTRYYSNMWAGDNDYKDPNFDNGITLSKDYLNPSKKYWFEAVATLVHELTHATAYYYYDVTAESKHMTFDVNMLQYIVNIHSQLNMADEISEYIENLIPKVEADTLSEDEYGFLSYLVTTFWGEYAAYQADADYADSIGADVISKGNDLIRGEGEYGEKTAIERQISEYEDFPQSQPYPFYKWWSYR